MKKFVSILIVSMLIITLSACGKEQNDPEEVKTTLPVTEETAPEDNSDDLFFNEENYTVERGEPTTYPDNAYQIVTTYTLKEKPERTLPIDITLDSEKITLNSTKITNLTNIGWTLVNGNKTDSPVKAHQNTNSVVCSPDGKKAIIYAANLTDNTINFNDCTIWDIIIEYEKNIYYDGPTEAADFDYADGITSASSLSDIINKLGEPYTIVIDEHFTDDELQYSKISIRYDVRKNINVSFEFRNEGNSSTMIYASFKYNQS